jgi:hypothetical protein
MNPFLSKPLTKERRSQIVREIEYCESPPSTGVKELVKDLVRRMPSRMDMIRDLVAAEAYWRELIKNHAPGCGDDNVCDFCDVSLDTRNHKPDCSWLLAQEAP